MSKFKNLTARLLTTFFIFSLTSINVQATSTQPNKENIKNEKEVIDITNDPNYVVSKGDVSLENIELSVNENELVINSKKRDAETINDLQKLKSLIEKHDGLEDDLINNIKENHNIISIGYSEALLKLNDKNEIVPVTKQELLSKSSLGEPQKYGKLTLYTFVDSAVSGNQRFTVGYSDAKWSGFDGFNVETAPYVGEDFISITIPSRYTILNNYFWGSYATSGIGNPTGRLTEVSQNSLIYAFDELTKLPGINATTYTNSIRIAARASTNNLTPTTEMYSSQYIHRYSKLNLSPSISSGGSIDWGIGSSDEAWKLSSYCTTNF